MDEKITEEYKEMYEMASKLAANVYDVGTEEYKEQKDKCITDMLRMYYVKHGINFGL